MNRRFSVDPEEQGSAFVGTYGADLDHIFSILHKNRAVRNDNTVRVNNIIFQIEKSVYRESFAKCKVDVYEQLNGNYTIIWKKRRIGVYNNLGLSLLGIPDGQKKGQSKRPCPSVSPPVSALGSLPSVALSSLWAGTKY